MDSTKWLFSKIKAQRVFVVGPLVGREKVLGRIDEGTTRALVLVSAPVHLAASLFHEDAGFRIIPTEVSTASQRPAPLVSIVSCMGGH